MSSCLCFSSHAPQYSDPHCLIEDLVAHWHLLPFPTRRSSDLGGAGAAGGAGVSVGAPETTGAPANGTCIAGAPTETPAPDRKSTRLNSSHRCISYAVFCLKKKKASSQLTEKDIQHRHRCIKIC